MYDNHYSRTGREGLEVNEEETNPTRGELFMRKLPGFLIDVTPNVRTYVRPPGPD